MMKKTLPWLAIVGVVLLMLDLDEPRAPGGGDEPWFPAQARVPGVSEVEASQIQVSCGEPGRCTQDYEALADRMGEEGTTGAARLFEGIEDRDLLVAELDNTPEGPIQQIRLLFEDPMVGVFEGLLLVPSGNGPWPARVAIPGRGQRTHQLEGSLESARSGVLTLVLQPRASSGGDIEAGLNGRLALVGLNLDQVRAYEAVLLHRYLSWRPDVNGDAISMTAHADAEAASAIALDQAT